jgi:hypothetical protein
MRRGVGGVLAVVLTLGVTAVCAPAPAADDVIYWPRREITFPVPVEKIQSMSPRPTKLRFYASPPRGKWEVVDERTPDALEVLDREKNRRGFRYTSPADGEYEFASQYVYAGGDEQPPRSELTAQYRVVFDTRPPVVRIAAVGRSGVEWDIRDDNLHPDGVELQVRWVGQSKWVPRSPKSFSSRDSYTWSDLTTRQPLEVRILARDRAGHEGVSQVVTLPTTGSGGGLDTGDPILRNPGGVDPAPRGTTRGGSGFGNPDDFPVQPQIEYANTRSLTVESRLTRVTRSGVKSANLWMNEGKGAWHFEKSQPLDITAATIDPLVKIPYDVKADGLYGFIVIPVNGAGGKQDDPKRDDPPQFLIEVDTVRPVVKVTGHKVSPGGAVGPRVELDWTATDKNLMTEPVLIEYSEDKLDWKPVHAGKLSNAGRYAWEVEDKNLWKFFVRVRAVDKAGNTGEALYEKEITVDTDVPAARIEKVQGSGKNEPHESKSLPLDPRPTPPPGTSPPSGGPPSVPKLPGF